MGVPGLWDLLRPAAARTSLSTLARDAFLTNRNGLRALTIGIDASIWIFHAQVPMHGENPFLRTIFYKITTLLQHPVLPVFVFDGPNKPSLKRNQHVAGRFGTGDSRSRQFKELLDVCGLEWWNAPGEAEAELAVMNRQGKIDAVLSDDVDALLFGATCLLRNNSPTLSGAQASSTAANASRGDLRHYEVFKSDAILKHWSEREGTALQTEDDCRLAMILVALLAGGDYVPEGLSRFGPVIAHGLAHAGFADFLKRYDPGSPVFDSELARIHEQVVDELRTNSTGMIGRKNPKLASDLATKDPSTLFSPAALAAYLRPTTSPSSDLSAGWPGFGNGEPSKRRGKARNEGRGDMEGMARACEQYFEWGTKELVGKKFAGESVGVFGSEIVNDARDWVRTRFSASRSSKSGSPSNPRGPSGQITSFFSSIQPVASMTTARAHHHTQAEAASASFPPYLVKVHSKRPDPTNSNQTEYRISYRIDDFTSRCHDAMEGWRVDPKLLTSEERAKLGLVDKETEPEAEPAPAGSSTVKSEVRVWLPEYILVQAWPDLVKAYEDELAAKEEAKRAKTFGGRKRVMKKAVSAPENTAAFRDFFSVNTKGKGKEPMRPMRATTEALSEEETEPLEESPMDQRPVSTPRRSTSTIDLTMSSPAIDRVVHSRQPLAADFPKRSRETSSSSRSDGSPKADTSNLPRSTSTRPPRRSARLSRDAGKSGIGNKDEPIDLCSSGDDVPTKTVSRPAGKTLTKPVKVVRIVRRRTPDPFPMSFESPYTSRSLHDNDRTDSPPLSSSPFDSAGSRLNASTSLSGSQSRLGMQVTKGASQSSSQQTRQGKARRKEAAALNSQ